MSTAKKRQYTDEFKIEAVREAGAPVPALCREHGMSGATFL